MVVPKGVGLEKVGTETFRFRGKIVDGRCIQLEFAYWVYVLNH